MYTETYNQVSGILLRGIGVEVFWADILNDTKINVSDNKIFVFIF